MERIDIATIPTIDTIIEANNTHIFSLDYRTYITMQDNTIYYTLFGSPKWMPFKSSPLLSNRKFHALASTQRVALIHGGYDTVRCTNLSDILIFKDCVLTRLASETPLRCREHAMVFLNDDSAILFGGYTINNVCNSKTFLYSISTNTWEEICCASEEASGRDTEGRRLPCARYGHTMINIKGRVLLFGGHTGSRVLRDVWELVCDTSNFDRVSYHYERLDTRLCGGWQYESLPCMYKHTCLKYAHYMIIIGGLGNFRGLFYLLDLSTNTWYHSLKRFPLNFIGIPAVILGDFILTTTFYLHVGDIEFSENRCITYLRPFDGIHSIRHYSEEAGNADSPSILEPEAL